MYSILSHPLISKLCRSPWEVLDFGDVILHLFTPDERQFYDLEAFYSGAAEVRTLSAHVFVVCSGIAHVDVLRFKTRVRHESD